MEQTAKNLRDQNARSKSQKSRSENSAAGSNRLNLCTISRVNGEHNNYRLNTFQAIKYSRYLHLKNVYLSVDHRRKALIEALNGTPTTFIVSRKRTFSVFENSTPEIDAGYPPSRSFGTACRLKFPVFRKLRTDRHTPSTFWRKPQLLPCSAILEFSNASGSLHAMDQALSSL